MTDEADQADVEEALEDLTEDFETPSANQFDINCEHEIVDHDQLPSELAIFPRDDCPGLTSEWIVATGDESFVDPKEIR